MCTARGQGRLGRRGSRRRVPCRARGTRGRSRRGRVRDAMAAGLHLLDALLGLLAPDLDLGSVVGACPGSGVDEVHRVSADVVADACRTAMSCSANDVLHSRVRGAVREGCGDELRTLNGLEGTPASVVRQQEL